LQASPATPSLFSSSSTRHGDDHSSRDSVISEEVFGFDEILRNTSLYRRAEVRQMIRPPLGETYGNTNAEAAVPFFPTSPLDSHIPVMSRSINSPAVTRQSANAFVDEAESAAKSVFLSTTSELHYSLPSNEFLEEIGLSAFLRSHSAKRRNSSKSQSSDSTIRAGKSRTSVRRPYPETIIGLGRDLLHPLNLPENHITRTIASDPPLLIPARVEGSQYPTLMEILGRRTIRPYSLFEFYVYVRDIQRSPDYLDFWYVVLTNCTSPATTTENTCIFTHSFSRIDVYQHMAVCRHYVRQLRKAMSIDTPTSVSSSTASFTPSEIKITRSDIKAAAERILYTYIFPGSECKLVLPSNIVKSMIHDIKGGGRDDPEIFNDAKYYVFQAWSEMCSRGS
jgi:hypothetical protein